MFVNIWQKGIILHRILPQHTPYLCVEQGIAVAVGAAAAFQAASRRTYHRSDGAGLRFDLFFNVLGQKVGIEFSAYRVDGSAAVVVLFGQVFGWPSPLRRGGRRFRCSPRAGSDRCC